MNFRYKHNMLIGRIANVLLSIIFTVSICEPVVGQKTAFRISIGPFSPADWTIKGESGDVGAIANSASAWPQLGFGDAMDFGFSCEREFADFSLRTELGGQRFRNEGRYHDIWSTSSYKGELDIYRMEVNFLFGLAERESRFRPFAGFGTGIYFGNITQETRYIYNDEIQRKMESQFAAPGFGVILGMDTRLFEGLFGYSELNYRYIRRDIELQDPGSGEKMKVENINFGGTTLRFGLGYRF